MHRRILIYVIKSPFLEIPPTSPPALDDGLDKVLFWPFPPNVNFQNHEGDSKGSLTSCGILRGQTSRDSSLGSGLSGSSLWGISSLGKDSSEARNWGSVALSREQSCSGPESQE